MSDGLDPELLAELAGIFREEAKERLAALREQLDALADPATPDLAGVYVAARREAHTIKGSAGTVGATDMRSTALRLEKRLELYARDAKALSADDAAVLGELCARLETALAAF